MIGLCLELRMKLTEGWTTVERQFSKGTTALRKGDVLARVLACLAVRSKGVIEKSLTRRIFTQLWARIR